jgi:hypothetical protein
MVCHAPPFVRREFGIADRFADGGTDRFRDFAVREPLHPAGDQDPVADRSIIDQQRGGHGAHIFPRNPAESLVPKRICNSAIPPDVVSVQEQDILHEERRDSEMDRQNRAIVLLKVNVLAATQTDPHVSSASRMVSLIEQPVLGRGILQLFHFTAGLERKSAIPSRWRAPGSIGGGPDAFGSL